MAGNTGVGNISNYNVTYSNGVLSVCEALSNLVTTNLDISDPMDGQVSLREAIDYSSQLSGADTITFDGSIFTANASTIVLTQGVLGVSDGTGDLTIQGTDVSTSLKLAVSGNDTSSIFNILSPTRISNLTLANGSAASLSSSGGAISVASATTLNLNDVTVSDSIADNGGAILAAGVVNIDSSTLARNTGRLTGGGIAVTTGIVHISNSTIALNNAPSGGGIYNTSGNLTLLNTIVSDNTGTTGPDLYDQANANNSPIGNATGAVISGSNNLANVTALLGSLDYWGGTTKVFPLLPGSPAIDSGTGTGVTDQRGITVAGAADMGSFQSRGFNITNTGGGGQVTMIGDAFPTNLTLNITSSYSEPVTGGVISFTFANSTGGGTSANGTGFTAATSQATIVQNANVSDGNITLTAVANANYSNETYTALGNATGANAAASYTMTNVGTPDLITITNGDYQSGPLTGNFGQTLAINVKDSVGNNIPRLSVTFTPQTTAYGATGNVAGAGDGVAHSAVTDASGNISGLTYASNGIGGLVTVVANATVASNSVRPAGTALENFHEGALGLNVQGGLTGRSFVNNVEAVLGNASLAGNLVTNGSVRIKYLGLNGTDYANTTGTAIPANTTSNVTFNYGATGIGGNQNSDQGDGIYQLEIDYTNSNFADMSQVTTVKFHWLFGDVNGDKVVDALDYRDVLDRSVYGRFGVYRQDTNGAGRVFTKDVTNVLRQRGRRVANYNPYG